MCRILIKYVQEIWGETGQMELMMKTSIRYLVRSEVKSRVWSVMGTASQTYFSDFFISFLRNYKKLEFFIVLACKIII